MEQFLRFLFVSLITIFIFSESVSVAQDSFQQNNYEIQAQTFRFFDIDGQPIEISISNRLQLPRDSAQKFIENVTSRTSQSVLISYPDTLTIHPKRITGSLDSQDKWTFLLPFAATATGKKAKSYVTNAIRNDGIGLVIVSVSSLYDNFLWMHADNLETNQKVFMVLFNTIISASFGFHKDLWTQATKPIQAKIASLLSFANVLKSKPRMKDLYTSFAASFTLGVPIQLSRLMILNLNDLSSAFSSFTFWGTTLSLTTLLTFTSFSWSEQIATVDEVKNPIAKTLLRRFMDARQFMMAYLSPSGKLLQPDTFGYGPVLVTLTHGFAGLALLIKSKFAIEWIEKSEFFKGVHKTHKVIDQWLGEKVAGTRMLLQDCKSLLQH